VTQFVRNAFSLNRESTMENLTKRAWAVAAVALLASSTAWAQPNGPECREHKLKGLYVFTASGYTQNGAVPKAIVELIRFNGDGTLVATGGTVSVGGTITVIQPGVATGTYTLDADCRGTLAFLPSGPNFNIFATPQGEDLWMVQTNPGNIFQGTVTKMAH
jgi:hypothetical protein